MKPTYKQFQIVGQYSFYAQDDEETIFGYDTYEEALEAATKATHSGSKHVLEMKSTITAIVKPQDVEVKEFSNAST